MGVGADRVADAQVFDLGDGDGTCRFLTCDLTVEYGGRVHIFGNLQGTLIVKDGAKVIHSGVVGGDIHNRGGRIFIELVAKTMGKIKTKSGDTTFETAQKFQHE